MHIPDGYLSPSTCATLYAAATPFWYVALRRVKKLLRSRTIPLLSVFAAFSFVVMMFNLPLPGGTTGHAVGMGMAAIVLGPGVSILAISTALLVQALLFGDGGITSYGANCFNMAVVGSLVSVGVYRVIAYRAALRAKRRVAAAGIGGYIGINAAALCAAVEFGLQPLLFHSGSGTPLYAPYPLSVSIPAMMIGHLTFAGLAEFVLSAGMVAYIQRADPELLRSTAPDAPAAVGSVPIDDGNMLLPLSRKLWFALALVLIVTPLGIVAGGTAWGEWHARSFSDASARQQIATASRNQAPPEHVPTGLARLSAFWQAPLPEYAPSFIRSAYFGYFVSAALGVAALVLLGLTASMVAAGFSPRPFRRISFVERTIRRFARAMDEALFAEELAGADGVLQCIDPRAKMIGLGSLIVAAIAVHQVKALLALLILAVVLAFLSRITIRMLFLRVWAGVLFFTGLIALPAAFLTAGDVLIRAPVLPLSITSQGLQATAILILRAECAATFVFLLVVTTPWNHLLRSLRWFRLPASIVALLEISYRYVFVLLEAAQNMFEARQTRWMGRLEPETQRRVASSTAAVLLDKAFQLSGEVHLAMQARGFRGNVMLLEDLRMTAANWMEAAAMLAASVLIIWFGR